MILDTRPLVVYIPKSRAHLAATVTRTPIRRIIPNRLNTARTVRPRGGRVPVGRAIRSTVFADAAVRAAVPASPTRTSAHTPFVESKSGNIHTPCNSLHSNRPHKDQRNCLVGNWPHRRSPCTSRRSLVHRSSWHTRFPSSPSRTRFLYSLMRTRRLGTPSHTVYLYQTIPSDLAGGIRLMMSLGIPVQFMAHSSRRQYCPQLEALHMYEH